MIKNIYCIKDNKAGFINPTTAINDSVAMRQYRFLLRDKNTDIGCFPADYDLYKIGEFNTETGEIISKVEYLCNHTIDEQKEGAK